MKVGRERYRERAGMTAESLGILVSLGEGKLQIGGRGRGLNEKRDKGLK
jgi:hypothetical protein